MTLDDLLESMEADIRAAAKLNPKKREAIRELISRAYSSGYAQGESNAIAFYHIDTMSPVVKHVKDW